MMKRFIAGVDEEGGDGTEWQRRTHTRESSRRCPGSPAHLARQACRLEPRWIGHTTHVILPAEDEPCVKRTGSSDANSSVPPVSP